MLRFAYWLATASTVLLVHHAHAQQPAPEVMVHIESKSPVDLFRRVEVPGRRWSEETMVCTAPCDEVVQTGPRAVFYVAGKSVPRSHVFPLERSGPTRVVVEPGGKGERIVGPIIIGLGGAAMTAGTIGLIAHAFSEMKRAEAEPTSEARNDSLVVCGGAGVVVGAAAVTIGIVLLAFNGTKVEVGEQPAARGSPLGFRF